MKRYLIIICLLMLLAQTTIFAQESNESLYLVKRFASQVTLDPIQEAALSVSNIRDGAVDKAEMKVVLRLCTTEEMKLALVKSAWLYPTIIKAFEGYGFDKKDIIVLKSGDCLSPTNVSANSDGNLGKQSIGNYCRIILKSIPPRR